MVIELADEQITVLIRNGVHPLIVADYARVLTRNAVRCLKCGDVAESKRMWDMVPCGCRHVCVDGGLAYPKRLWNGDREWEEVSEYAALPPEVVRERLADLLAVCAEPRPDRQRLADGPPGPTPDEIAEYRAVLERAGV